MAGCNHPPLGHITQGVIRRCPCSKQLTKWLTPCTRSCMEPAIPLLLATRYAVLVSLGALALVSVASQSKIGMLTGVFGMLVGLVTDQIIEERRNTRIEQIEAQKSGPLNESAN
jgi:hypothetical protein